MSAKLYIFGTCSGTEPYPGRHHCSFAVEHEEKLYWFDAGESCSHTAYVMGVDPRKIHSIFISHPHMDHVGGLANLMWTIRKLDGRYGGMEGRTVNLFMPNEQTWPAVRQVLSQTEGDFRTRFSICDKRIRDGVLLDEGGVKVEAMHNLHLPQLDDGSWRSFSFRITVGGRVIVFSGDVKNYSEIEPLIRGAHVLLAETGHHRPAKVCGELNEMGHMPEKLLFIHHGRAILDEGQPAIDEAKTQYKAEIVVLNDGDVLSV
ncbi:MAG: ribonuclease Z [Clostridia bacterium]|nr:ribonuclease Z [Clostridia bacterium]